MKEEHINEIKAIIIFACGIIVFASLASFVPEDLSWYTSHPNNPAKNLIRITGAYIAGSLFFIFGYSSYALVVFLFFCSWIKFVSRALKFTPAKLLSFLIFFFVLSSLFSISGVQESILRFQRAGLAGTLISDFLVRYLGIIGAYTVLLMMGAMALILTGEFLVSPLFWGLLDKVKAIAGIYDRIAVRKKFVPAARIAPNVKSSLMDSSLQDKIKAKIKAEESIEQIDDRKKNISERQLDETTAKSAYEDISSHWL